MFKFHPPTPQKPKYITITYIDEIGDNRHDFVAHQDFIDLEDVFVSQRMEHYLWMIDWMDDRISFYSSTFEEKYDPFKTDQVEVEQTFSIKKTPQRVESLLTCLKDWDTYHARYHNVPRT